MRWWLRRWRPGLAVRWKRLACRARVERFAGDAVAEEAAPLVLESRPVAVVDRMADDRGYGGRVWALALHGAAILLIGAIVRAQVGAAGAGSASGDCGTVGSAKDAGAGVGDGGRWRAAWGDSGDEGRAAEVCGAADRSSEGSSDGRGEDSCGAGDRGAAGGEDDGRRCLRLAWRILLWREPRWGMRAARVWGLELAMGMGRERPAAWAAD